MKNCAHQTQKTVPAKRGVAAQRTSEEALRQSEEKFRTLVDEASEMLFVHDLDGHIREVNRAAIEGTGYSRSELLNLEIWDLDPNARERNDQKTLWRGLPFRSRATVETRHRRKNGSEYPAEVRIAKVEFGGQPYILALASDITQRQQAERKILESEQRLSVLMDNLPGMAYRCANNPNWTMEFVSDGALALTGYPPGVFVGENSIGYYSLIHPGDRKLVWTQIQEALEQDQIFTIEYRIHDAQGKEKWVQEKGRCVDDTIIEGFMTDITKRKRYEEALAEKVALENKLRQLQKTDSINRLAGAVAHHFNNKLHAVISSLELIKMQAADGVSDVKIADIAMEAAQQAADISRLMLICLGQSRIERKRLDLTSLCRELRPTLAAAMPQTVLLDLALTEKPLEVWANAESIRQIVNHLIANAWEAEGTRHVELRTFQMKPDEFGEGFRNPIDWNPSEGIFAIIEVTDDGPGMSATIVEQIFDPFFSTKFTGRGIGLALVLGLTRSHGGGVVVNSTLGKGTVFRICIPAAGNTSD